MWYVQAQGDTFIRHIFDAEPTQWDENNYCHVRRLTPEQVAHFGVHKKQIVTPPYFDPATQVREEGPAVLVDGVWTQNYVVTDLDADVSAAKVHAQWDVVRAERDLLLDKCDWWVTKAIEKNATISAEQHAYREALRDITTQSDPFNIVWPEGITA
jgi:hypothetical protein